MIGSFNEQGLLWLAKETILVLGRTIDISFGMFVDNYHETIKPATPQIKHSNLPTPAFPCIFDQDKRKLSELVQKFPKTR